MALGDGISNQSSCRPLAADVRLTRAGQNVGSWLMQVGMCIPDNGQVCHGYLCFVRTHVLLASGRDSLERKCDDVEAREQRYQIKKEWKTVTGSSSRFRQGARL